MKVEEKQSSEAAPAGGLGVSKMGSQNDLNASVHGISMRVDLDTIEHLDLELEPSLIATIPPKKIEQFVDPYKYFESVDPNESQGNLDAPNSRVSLGSAAEPFVEKPENQEPTYLLGKNRPRDTEGGDAGGILRRARFFPVVNFVRSQFCGRQRNSILHSDVPN